VGYRTVALNQTVNENAMNNDKKKKQETKLVTSVVPDPIDVSELNEKWRGKLRILNRITFICSSSTKAHTVVQFLLMLYFVFKPFIFWKQSNSSFKHLSGY